MHRPRIRCRCTPVSTTRRSTSARRPGLCAERSSDTKLSSTVPDSVCETLYAIARSNTAIAANTPSRTVERSRVSGRPQLFHWDHCVESHLHPLADTPIDRRHQGAGLHPFGPQRHEADARRSSWDRHPPSLRQGGTCRYSTKDFGVAPDPEPRAYRRHADDLMGGSHSSVP